MIGSPDGASLEFLRSENARKYVKELPKFPRQKFSSRFPSMNSTAIDLLEKMLVFDPAKRITGMIKMIHIGFGINAIVNSEILLFVLQLRKHCVIPIYQLFTTLTMSLFVPNISVSILRTRLPLKKRLKSLCGSNL